MARTDELSAVLRKELESYSKDIRMVGVGTVMEVGDGICRIYGLEEAMAGELVEFPDARDPQGNAVRGIVLNLEEDSVGVVLMGSDRLIEEGSECRTTGEIFQVPVGRALLGRVVSPLGDPRDGKGPLVESELAGMRRVEVKAPGVIEREPVTEPLKTGIKAIDTMIPVGRGQRELVIGDRQTGKSALCIDTIINQKYTHDTDTPVYCIYVAIGQRQGTLKKVVAELEKHGAMDYTIVIDACAATPPPLQYIAPYAGCAMGEFFRDNGMHALIIYDDLSKHAVAYRTVSLLLRRPPGREAFPGDVFNLHSRLLERAAKMRSDWIIVAKDAAAGTVTGVDGQVYLGPRGKHTATDKLKELGDGYELRRVSGGGSLTALPIIETQANDISAYIPTNVISITDGQIFLEPDLFYAGIRPAINVGLSVSRVGGAAQTKAVKSVARTLKLDMARYNELAAFAKFASDLDASTQRTLNRGEHLVELLKQPQYQPLIEADEVYIVYAGTSGLLDDVPLLLVAEFEKELLAQMSERYPELGREIMAKGALTEDSTKAMQAAVAEFKAAFAKAHGFGAEAAAE
ncbi:MAG: F0F1 ATP synthase subunit alpha [Armatimonadetes bacterium]|nr:F0F1 ATP synthase subunit alpha [Armatimonadota bacterium]